MQGTRIKVLLLYANDDNHRSKEGEVSKLAEYIVAAIGEKELDLRLWWDFLAGTAKETKDDFAQSAHLIVAVLSVNFLNCKSCQEVTERFQAYRTENNQRQIPILFWDCPFEKFATLKALEILPHTRVPVVGTKGHDSIVLTEISKRIAAIARSAVSKPKLGDNGGMSLQYACDRTEQIEAFEDGRTAISKPPRFFFIHGTEEQSHHGFAIRMQMELIGQFFKHNRRDVRCNLQKLYYPPARDMELAKRKLLAKLHDDFGLNPDEKTPLEDQRFGKLLLESNVTSPFRNKDLVLLQILINDFDFEKGQTQEVIHWANTQFFDRAEFADDAPEVIILWTLVYTGEGDDEENYDRYRKLWEATSRGSGDWLLIPELQAVRKRDVKRWMQEYAANLDSIAQDEIINSAFGSNRTLDMAHVERTLATILKNNYQE